VLLKIIKPIGKIKKNVPEFFFEGLCAHIGYPDDLEFALKDLLLTSILLVVCLFFRNLIYVPSGSSNMDGMAG
jgi:hypothetical protein